MSLAMDQVFVMGYDSQDNILVGQSFLNRGRKEQVNSATASSPLDKVQSGLESYLALGIPASKLVLGVHWMSFVFPCIFTRHRRPGTIPPCFVDFKVFSIFKYLFVTYFRTADAKTLTYQSKFAPIKT